MFNKSTFCSHKKVSLIDLEHIGGSSLVFEGFYDILATGLKIHNGKKNLGFVIVRETKNC